MIDLHCHILPGVDDGAVDVEMALEMAKELARAGFTQIAASPHFGEGPGGDVPRVAAAELREMLNVRLGQEGIDMRILPNAEHHVTPELFGRIDTHDIVPIGGDSSWLLVEFPWGGIVNAEQVMFRLQSKGHQLLLAHPERYTYMHVETVGALVDRGVKIQLEIGSFLGMYGKRAEEKAKQIMKNGWAHVLASDLHRPKAAAAWIKDALGRVEQMYGKEAVHQGITVAPKGIIENIDADELVPLFQE